MKINANTPPADFAVGDRVQIVFRYPEDEGFARSLFHLKYGEVVHAVLQPGDDRLCVRPDGSEARGLFSARELVRA